MHPHKSIHFLPPFLAVTNHSTPHPSLDRKAHTYIEEHNRRTCTSVTQEEISLCHRVFIFVNRDRVTLRTDGTTSLPRPSCPPRILSIHYPNLPSLQHSFIHFPLFMQSSISINSSSFTPHRHFTHSLRNHSCGIPSSVASFRHCMHIIASRVYSVRHSL
ncbi:hypothetical protein BD410DRAFT_237390 [Rickenella mellea]|uniref:Uncharacterized protein n=1 Tax=Rickenella mellea TaxID=50990 RepID=A0A4Y7QN28_9AGAM|nr:hypothetical protein BD410DRAFT_237390 [Rickenella mellea]